MYKISAILPTFNRPKFLESSLLALNEQTFKDFEVIVIDDGSNDYEANFNKMICDVYKNLGLNLTYFKLHENSGTVSIPRNIGIANAIGEFIAPIDDDCWCNSDKFEVLLDIIGENNDNVLAYGERVDCELKDGKIHYGRTSDTFYLQHDKTRLGVDNGQFIYKSDIYDLFGPIFPINACDWETYKLIGQYGSFNYTPNIVCKYIWHNTNSSRTPKKDRINPMEKIWRFKEYFKGTRFEDAIASIL